MNTQLLKYLQQDGVGKVVAKGLADVYTNKPSTPVKYLACWLKKYSCNQKEVERLCNAQKQKANKLKDYQAKVCEEEKKVIEKKAVDDRCMGQLEAFKCKVQNDEYQKEFLYNELPQFLEKRIGLTGVYIGHVKHPPKQVTEQDEDDNAHLDTSQPKMINYIGSSASHQTLMKHKTLVLDKGVTGGAFSLSLQDPVPEEDGTVVAKEKYVYIPNVVKNENMHYFRLPKLGAYIAIPLIYNSYLCQNIFDVALDDKQKYLEELKEFQKQRGEALKEISTQTEAINVKLEQAKEKNDEAAIQTLNAQLIEVNKKKKEKEDEKCDEGEIDLPTEKRQFVVCGDTMGQDCQICPEKRQMLLEVVKHFRDCWQKKQKELLYKDVNYQVNIKKDHDKTPEEVIEHLQKCCEIPAQTKANLDQIQDQKLREYKKSTCQLDALRCQIKQGQRYLSEFFKLKNFRVVKFRDLIQTLLYFLGYKKAQINKAGQTVIDWKKVRANYLFADTFKGFLSYNSEGPKNGQYPFYCKLEHINEKLEKCSEEEVFKYNLGLGALLMLVKKLIAHRLANIDLRRAEKEKERERIATMNEENSKAVQEKQAALQKHKLTLSVEDLNEFKPETWQQEYDKENPLLEIPPDVVDDIDNDF